MYGLLDFTAKNLVNSAKVVSFEIVTGLVVLSVGLLIKMVNSLLFSSRDWPNGVLASGVDSKWSVPADFSCLYLEQKVRYVYTSGGSL